MNDAAPLILGSGPAGIAAALCCAEIGLKPLLVDPAPRDESLGGLIALSDWPAIWTPWAEGKSGVEVGRELAARLAQAGIPRFADAALSIDPARRIVRLRDRGEMPYRALVIATGAGFRRIEVPGAAEAEAAGWLLQRPPLRPEPASPPGGTTVVLGSGNNAFSTAALEAKRAGKVIVAVRGGETKVRPQILDEAAALPNVALRLHWEAAAFSTEDKAIRFRTPEGEKTVPCDLAYANLGYAPRSGFAKEAVRRNEAGFIEVDNRCRTSAAGIWALGEVTGPHAPSVLTVMGQAPTVAEEIAAALADADETRRQLGTMERR